jgi:hypothetical protein
MKQQLLTMRRLARGVRDGAHRMRRDVAWAVRRRRVASSIARVAPLPPADRLRGATLFFVPYAGVTPMFSQTCVVARTLRERGHRVFVARCFRLFDRCPAMDNDRLPADAGSELKRESCLHCADNSLSMLAEYGLEALDLRALVTPEMTARVDAAMSQAPQDLFRFEFAGLRFGALAAMDLILAKKLSDFSSLSPADRGLWCEYLRSCLLAHLLVDRACREFQVARIAVANDYSMLLGARTAARANGVPCYTLAFPGHRNVDLRRYLILSNIYRPISFKLLASWPDCRELSLDAARVREVAEDLLVRLGGRGSHIYSPGKTLDDSDVRRSLGLSSERRLIVAFTSSLDEAIASRVMVEALGIELPERRQPFADQIEWLKWLTDFVERSDDLQLVVRIHPREGVSKHRFAVSQHLLRLREAFSGRYQYCRFVWPDDPVSSYDIGEAAELVLTSWSTIGLEMARLGAPVITAFRGPDAAVVHDDFLEWAATPAEYAEKIHELLDRRIELPQVIRAFRWYSLFTFGPTVDLTDVIPRSDFAALPPYRTPAEAATIEQILIDRKEVWELNIERLERAQRPDSAELEESELKRQLRRIVHFVMTGDLSSRDAPLVVRAMSASRTAMEVDSNGGTEPSRILEYDGFNALYRDGNRIGRRYSPMAVRLAMLCGDPAREPSAVGGAR